MKTSALKQALDEHKFDIAIGGVRRDEEKSRAKKSGYFHFARAHISGIQRTSAQNFGATSTFIKIRARASAHFHYQIGPRWIFGCIFTENKFQSYPFILQRNGQSWNAIVLSSCWTMTGWNC